MKLTRVTAGFPSARKAFPAGSDGEFRDALLDTLLKTYRHHSGTQKSKQDCCIDRKATRLSL